MVLYNILDFSSMMDVDQEIELDNLSMQEINLVTLHSSQLLEVKNQLDLQLSEFEDVVNTMKEAQNRYLRTIEVLKKMRTVARDSSVIVPISRMLCVPGILPDPKHVIVDIGCELLSLKTITSAKAYFKRQVAYINEQLEKFQILGVHKLEVRNNVRELLEEESDAESEEVKIELDLDISIASKSSEE